MKGLLSGLGLGLVVGLGVGLTPPTPRQVRVVSYNYARTERTFFDKVPDRVRNLTCRRL